MTTTVDEAPACMNEARVDGIRVDGSKLRKAQIEAAFDVLTAERGRDAAITGLSQTLADAGYPQAAHLDAILSAYEARRTARGTMPAVASGLDDASAQLVIAVAGSLPDAGPADDTSGATAGSASQIADTDDAGPASDKTAETGGSQTETHPTTDEDSMTAQTAEMQSAETKAAETKVTDTKAAGKKAAAKTQDKTSETTTVARTQSGGSDTGFEFSGLAALKIADTTRINKFLATASSKRIKTIETVIDALVTAEDTVQRQEDQIAAIQQVLAQIEAGDTEAAQQIEIGAAIPAKASGLTEITLSEDHGEFVDAALDKATDGQVETYAQLIGAVQAAEERAAQNAERLRELHREVKSKGPKPKAKARVANAAGQVEDELDCEVVYRKASDIFVNAFGHTSPILDFEIPTLEWAGAPHPDVPEKIDSFKFFAPVLAKALFALKAGKIMWLMGETGCGKSEFWAQVAARIGFPFIRMNMDSHLTRADLVGASRLVPGENGQPVMTFVEGIIPRALQMPCILLIDEFDLGDPEIMPTIQPVLEGKGIRLLEDGGRYIKPHELCSIAATGNTNGLGSDNNVYLNAHEQSGATRDRIAMYVEMPYLPADKELEVVMARVPHADSGFAEKVIQLANQTRESYRLGDIGQLVSTRHVLDACELHAHSAPLYQDDEEVITDVLEVTVLNFMDSNARSVTRGYIDAIFA